MRILMIEDEPRLATRIARGLRAGGMAVDVAADGEAGMEKVRLHPYEVVLVDRDGRATRGDDVCRQIVAERVPARIVLLGARDLDALLDGFALGADDYLAKPFDVRELIVRINALARRPGRALPPVLTRGDVELDPSRREVRRGGVPVVLQRKEFAVLRILLEAGGAVVTSEELLERAWDENVDPFTNVVRMNIMTLRRKLGEPGVIDTVAGVGYRIA